MEIIFAFTKCNTSLKSAINKNKIDILKAQLLIEDKKSIQTRITSALFGDTITPQLDQIETDIEDFITYTQQISRFNRKLPPALKQCLLGESDSTRAQKLLAARTRAELAANILFPNDL